MVDSAAGFGSVGKHGSPLGRQGDAEVFSFHATRHFAVGVVATTRAEAAALVERRADFGFEHGVVPWRGRTNAKLPECSAATVLAVLDGFGDILARRGRRQEDAGGAGAKRLRVAVRQRGRRVAIRARPRALAACLRRGAQRGARARDRAACLRLGPRSIGCPPSRAYRSPATFGGPTTSRPAYCRCRWPTTCPRADREAIDDCLVTAARTVRAPVA
jgi:hypothetical protein